MITGYPLEFFELGLQLKNTENLTSVYHKLLKLNNPTYINKHTTRHPLENHGYSNTKTINPVVLAVQNMLAAYKHNLDTSCLLQKLQTEYAWAFHNYPWYTKLQ